MKHRVFGSRVLVKVLETNDRTSGGLYIPQLATDNTPWMKAEVIAVGQGILSGGVLFPLPVAVGDVVVFFRSMQPGDQLVVPLDDGEKGLVIRFESCLEALEDLDKVSPIVDVAGKNLVLQS